MPTTTKMGIVYPSSTDLVKDGATAMGTISTTVDSKTGLILISTITFSAVSSVSFANNTFTTNYNTYFFTFDITGSTALNVGARLRASGTDNTSTIYNDATWQHTNPVGSSNSTNQTSWAAIIQANGADMTRNGLSWILSEPKSSTKFTVGHTNYVSNISTTPYPILNWQTTNVTTSFDSVTFLTNTGTISGTISCFGFNK